MAATKRSEAPPSPALERGLTYFMTSACRASKCLRALTNLHKVAPELITIVRLGGIPLITCCSSARSSPTTREQAAYWIQYIKEV